MYVGAGTSGRIGVQDGTELTPTFDWPPERLVFVMAGGVGALVQGVEGAEDSEDDGARAVVVALAEELAGAARLDRERFRAVANQVKARTGQKAKA